MKRASPGVPEPSLASFQVAAGATVLIVLVGLPAAWCLARLQFPGKGLVAGVLVLPLVLPPTVLGYLLLQVLALRLAGRVARAILRHDRRVSLVGRRRRVGRRGISALSPAGGSALEAVDPRLEDAARLLGRTELSVFRSVTLPLACAGLAAGTVLAFARALGDFGATVMVAGNIPGLTQTASLAIYDAVQAGEAARAGWLAAAISLVSIVAMLVVQRTVPARGGGR